MIAHELGASGHQVEIACDGQEALISLQSSAPDAIVLDLMMPKLSGWDFVEQYRAHTGGQTIPIVVVSAAGAVPRSMETLGVKRFLPKPFAIDALEQFITEVTSAP
jgi:two-component system response regulator MprA